MQDKSGAIDLFNTFKQNILNSDPVYFCENFLTLDGKPFQLNGNGYKPFADIYRYVGLKAVLPDSRGVVLVKGRQVGATTMAAALELYFMACGLYGTNNRSSMAIMHLFPTLSLAAAYTKDKLDSLISTSKPMPGIMKNNGMLKSFMETKLESSDQSGNNQHYKRFVNNNKIWIESTGLDGDRVRGRQLSLDTELPTPKGFIKLADLQEGDQLFDENGNICNVVKLHPINLTPEAYKVTFDDGTEIEACAEHLWSVNSKIKNTKEILQSLNQEKQFVPQCLPSVISFPITKIEKSNNTDRTIIKIESTPTKPMRCITVDSPSHLYLVTRAFIATHNTVDTIFYDECFPYNQKIELENNQTIAIGEIFDLYTQNKSLPLVKTYNEKTKQIEFKKITKAWKRDKRQLVELTFESNLNSIISIKCTNDHRFLIGKENESWVKAKNLIKGDFAVVVQKDKTDFAAFIECKETDEFVEVYDISVEDNHNFIVNELIAHNCQDMNDVAIGTAAKILTQAKYGPKGNGVQVFFGTPKTKGGSYWKTWQNSTQNYFHLRCEKCGEYFPLYRPDVNWEDVWLYGMTVRCTQCKHEQEKNQAAESGKWIPLAKNPDSCDFVGYHINQLYIPFFTKEVIEKQKPERNPSNSERLYMNEVLGEFYDGDGSTLSVEEIHNKCADRTRAMARTISPERNKKVYVGFDWGQKAQLDQTSGRRQGKSYSCAVVLTSPAPNIFEVEFATRLMRNDPEEKMNVVEEMFRRYSVALSIGDIGDAFDLTHKLQRKYGDMFLASRSSHRINGHVKYSEDEFPKVIMFEKDYYISEMIGLLKEGRIKFPYKDYEKIDWLIKHCASMDIKITRDKTGEPMKKYIKGDGPNDGLMALLNAYLAWKFDVTQGFKIKNPSQMKYEKATQIKTVGAILGYVPGLSRG